MADLFTFPILQALDNNADQISGAELNFFEAGTSTPLDTFSDEGLTVANTNPVIADSAGRFGEIWLKAQNYKVTFTDAAQAVIWTQDPYHGISAVIGDDYKTSPQDPEDLTVMLSAGSLFRLDTRALVTNAAQTSPAVVAPSVNPRNDIVHIDRLTGVVAITTGSEAPSPSDPTIPVGKLPVARIRLAITTTTITDTLIDDIRELEQIGDLGPEDIQGQTFTAFNDTGAADAYMITPVPPIAAYAKYQVWQVDIANANTAASTMNINALGTRNIFDFRTGVALAGGEILAGLHFFMDDGTQLILMNPATIVDTQTFTASGTWTKPSAGTWTLVTMWGGGGGGGGGEGRAASNIRTSGAGGGGGGYSRGLFLFSELGATEVVTIGTVGSSGAGGSTNDGTVGGNGGDTTFGSVLLAAGGAGGLGGTGTGVAGGDSGGSIAAGSTAGAFSGVSGGTAGNAGNQNDFSGGSGGAGSQVAGRDGGSGRTGPGGGGGGGGVNVSDVEAIGGVGGATNSGTVGGGGAAGATNGGAGGNGTAGDSTGAGTGAGGGGGQDSGTGGVGGNGAQPGGGGGGGGGGTTTGGAGGTGGLGQMWVITW